MVQVEELLTRVLALVELPNMAHVGCRNVECRCRDVDVGMWRMIVAKLQRTYRVMKVFLRRVLFKMTSPCSLLEISATSVLNYHLSTDDLPKELEVQVREVKVKIKTLENAKKYLEQNVSSLLSEVRSTVSEIEIACNSIINQ